MKSLRRCSFSMFGACFVFSATLYVQAQHVPRQDSVNERHAARSWKKVYRTPALLVGAGLITFTDNELFDKWEVNEERNAIDPHFRTHVDDYLQYSPAVALYALDAFGMKGGNDLLNRTLLLVKSELIMSAITFPLKAITHEPRPDTGTPNSFPSGHTAQAFTAATLLHLEYGKDYPLVSVLGYVTASGIGVLRVMNNRHWICDVLAGAGIGVLSTNLAYHTHRYRWGRAAKKYTTMLSPTVLSGALGVNMRVVIR